MISQRWIVDGRIQMLAVQHRPRAAPVAAAILFPGFSHAMCDIDYFMSKLARELVALDFLVVQIDPRGHGDSPGAFAAVEVDTLRRDISVAVDHVSASCAGEVVCVGRGLLATLLAELSPARVLGVAGVSPYTLDPTFVGAYFDALGSNAGDAGDLLPGTKYPDLSDFTPAAVRIIHALGALAYNLHGLQLGAGLIEDLASFDAQIVLRERDADSCLWLGPSEEATAIFAGIGRGVAAEPSVHDEPSLPRDPALQAKLTAQISAWARGRVLQA